MKAGHFELTLPEPALRAPHCIAMLRPWVNVGNVGMNVLGRLAKVYGATEAGRVERPGRFYDFTRYRPEIRTVRGERSVTVPNTVIMTARRESPPDLVLFQMLEPHVNAEDFNDSVMETLKLLGVRRYVLIGGMYDSVPHSRPLLITGSARGWEPPPDFAGVKLSRSTYQGPTSMTSQLSERARAELGVETLSLIAHLPMYLKLDDDYAGAARLLKALSSLYGFTTDVPEIEMGARQYSQVAPAMAENPQLQEMVQAFEREYDQQQAEEQKQQPPLSPEIEQFLKDVEKNMDGGAGQTGPRA